MNARQTEFRRQLDALPSWKERAQRIAQRLRQTSAILATRNEKLLALRLDFDALTCDFWKAFGRGLGCEDPERTILNQKERLRSVAYLGTIGLIIGLSVFSCIFCLSHGNCRRGRSSAEGARA